MSTYGIPQILQRINAFAGEVGQDIHPFGIVVSKYRAQATEHQVHVDALRRKAGYPPVFDAMIPETNELSAAAAAVNRSTLRQRWGGRVGFPALDALGEELVAAVEDD